jgi:Tfp pilus assembly protein PilF
MGFWRREAIDPAMDAETQRQMREQMDWIAREPANARPYYHLALLYRMQWKPEEALGLLLEAVRLDESFADAHAALTDLYVVRGDYAAAWRHARTASANGQPRGVELLNRYGLAE